MKLGIMTWPVLLVGCSSPQNPALDADLDASGPAGSPYEGSPGWPPIGEASLFDSDENVNTSGCQGPNDGCGNLWCFPDCPKAPPPPSPVGPFQGGKTPQ